MRLDIHVHTSPGSRCSVMSADEYLVAAARLGLESVCLTNHGNIDDARRLSLMAPPELAVIAGVELSSPLGDFLIFSTNQDFLRTLEAVQLLPDRAGRPAQTAVVWAHPFAGNRGGLNAGREYLKRLVPLVDGIEVYNGNWPDADASALARQLASANGLAQMGGSDAHRHEDLMRCWTDFEADIKNAAELIAAILSRKAGAGKL